MKQPAAYTSDQREFHDQVAIEAWDSYNWQRRAVRERYDAEQIFRYTGSVRRILQVGSGAGSQDPILASYDFVEEVHGIDPSQKMVEQANRHFPHPKVKRWVAGYQDLAEEHHYDLTLSVDVFEHISEPNAFLAKMRGVVRPGGYIAVLTPNRLRWQNIALRLRGKPTAFLSSLHYYEYSVGELKRLAKRENLKFVGYFGEEVYGPWATSLDIRRSLLLGRWLKPIAHVIGVVFRTPTGI
jgi:2-polyprenyl-3-methyl-5-hydroxy-6-metoxy-1,4-benzoquinol methylase